MKLKRPANFINEIGNRYSKLVVIKEDRRDKVGRVCWQCKCDCGNITIVLGTNLRRGYTKSCGCLKRLPQKGLASFHGLICIWKRSAEKRGLKFDLSEQQIKGLIAKPCFYCGMPPSNNYYPKYNYGGYTYSGLDRINNKEGYAIDNVVPCCFVCNRAKRTKTIPEFLDWFKRLIKHNRWDYKNIDNIKFEEKAIVRFTNNEVTLHDLGVEEK